MAINCTETVYGNFGRCVCLDNGKIRLIATVEVGPRIVYFGFSDGDNVLFEDVERNFYEMNRGYGVWYAYGGHRLWCAPEKMPETYLPDNSPVTVNFCDDILTLTASPTIFGKQFSIIIAMDDNDTVVIENKITNISDKPAEFAPWSVTGLASGGVEYIPLNSANTGFLPNRTMALWSYSDIRDDRFELSGNCATLRQDTAAESAFKAGFNVTDGYITYKNGGTLFRLSFDPWEDINYPDFRCNFETYTNKLFLECEVLGGLRSYASGESAVIREKWQLEKIS